ncbi:hypothetical protein SETIT_4G214300v2 [Setaria italica]|uniref:Uncharacterized protein n=1 Tax=Setaria italica TaxID=4555 RepID=A0A368QWQ0_SETIT|nr:hypothetical protein SETIT_4G214300v2 [Setaria italica]
MEKRRAAEDEPPPALAQPCSPPPAVAPPAMLLLRPPPTRICSAQPRANRRRQLPLRPTPHAHLLRRAARGLPLPATASPSHERAAASGRFLRPAVQRILRKTLELDDGGGSSPDLGGSSAGNGTSFLSEAADEGR